VAITDDLKEFLQERDRILRELDVHGARKMLLNPDANVDMVMLALHKARYNCTSIERPLRLLSKRWLAAGGYGGLAGQDLLPNDELPS
jgi:hypothetical protein